MTQALSSTDIAFDLALREVTTCALRRYPAEQARIERGANLVRHGLVTLLADAHVAIVRSANHPGVMYHVNGTCECADFAHAANGHCKHRWGKTLLRRAQTVLGQMWYASYEFAGDTAVGFVLRTGNTWYFVWDTGDRVEVDPRDVFLTFGGRCDVVAHQYAADGPSLAAKVSTEGYMEWRMRR